MNSEQAKKLAVEGDLDYQELGFMCGLEIHQQLATRKLFSPCPSDVIDPEEVAARTIGQVDRKLRATQSEMGNFDVAALAEAKKQKRFRYLIIDGLTSLVELDEEPPHPMSDEALDVCLSFSGLLGANPAQEIHVMRKTVIDGSNTSGFQRTALVATGGKIDVSAVSDGNDVGVWTVAVEEDSARKVDDQDGMVSYTLDRLGVPLIEVATAPDVVSPKHAQQTAARIGSLLRATGKVRRGLGSIRQDLNVSIMGGNRVEIKGCQDLRAVPAVIEKECRRQLWMHYIKEELLEREFTDQDIGAVEDVSGCFAETEAKLVAGALKRKQGVFALPLRKWAGLIAGAGKEHPRMGREFADYAKQAAGVKGVFHSDELPAYGISEEEVARIQSQLKLSQSDAFVLCVERKSTANNALQAVAHRALLALEGTLAEVRAAQPDETTRYMRPMPGAARMYPETDVPPIYVVDARWQNILAHLPPRPEEVIASLENAHGLSNDIAKQLVAADQVTQFNELLAAGAEPAMAGRILLQIVPELQNPDQVMPFMAQTFAALAKNQFAKEAIGDVLAAFDQGATTIDEAIAKAGVAAVDESEVADIVAKVVGERLDFVKERGMGAMGPLMGPVMAELRGKADGKAISAALQAELQKHL